jgi:hypothetical protein
MPALVFARGYTIHNHERRESLNISVPSSLKTMLHEIVCDNAMLYYSEKD